MRRFIAFAALSIFGYSALSQTTSQLDPNGRANRIIHVAVPFLTITPDSRAGAMGDVGVATDPDGYSVYWNPAKLPFLKFREPGLVEGDDVKTGFSVNYTPWLRKVINDMYMANIQGYRRLRKEEMIGVGLTYFDYGNMQFTDEFGNPIKDHNPREFALQGSYARKLSKNLGLAVGLKFIHSNLSGELNLGTSGTARPANTAAGDISMYYKNKFLLDGYNMDWAIGATIQNLGGKISYTTNDQQDFIPTILRLGGKLGMEIDEYNKISLNVDVNKLMVPTPPIYLQTNKGADSIDANGSRIIAQGKDPNRGYFSGVFGSFTDAPGGFKEEMQEFTLGIGGEYWYNNQFAVRAGYFAENKYKGNRKFFTIGVGIRYQVMGFDFSYLLSNRENPLADTFRLSLVFNFKDNKVGTGSVTE